MSSARPSAERPADAATGSRADRTRRRRAETNGHLTFGPSCRLMSWMEGSDRAAVARARAGDRDAFRELVEAHSRAVFRLAYRLTGNEEDAEDVVQETFLKAYSALPRFQGSSEVATWLHRIASN